ncbi:MAG: helix-turn-helix protein [Chitinophagaceae bacterium]|nr:helix-turn-helix protein [Chitinophagaceae bacterium]
MQETSLLGFMKLSDIDIEHLNEARELIDKDVSRHYTILDIARQVGLSASRLTRGFKILHQMGLFKYLEKARLKKGKYLIENTDKSLKEISNSLGYKYRNSFSLAFKKKFGIDPRSWRKNLSS